MPTEHLQLMAKHHDLQVLGVLAAPYGVEMWRAMLWSAVVVFGSASVSGPASAQMGTPAQPPGQAPPMGGGMMPGMMCPMMMGGMGMMGSSADPKLMGRMLQMRGEMMKAMGDVI